MKTYEQLMTHYWGVIVPMAEAAGINPWECVKTDTGYVFHNHPQFNNNDPENYTFALTVLEKRPVFVGDRLYGKNLPITVLANEHFNLGDYTWTPPTKKRTFMLGDKEFVRPSNKESQCWFVFSGHTFYFETEADRNATKIGLVDFMLTARDKE